MFHIELHAGIIIHPSRFVGSACTSHRPPIKKVGFEVHSESNIKLIVQGTADLRDYTKLPREHKNGGDSVSKC
jgi:hypothetical protein